MSFPRRLPFALSSRTSSLGSGATYSPQGREYDVAIGGIPFMLATMSELPQGFETIKVRKDQFDTEDPGEQSLTGWWRRSQSSFHDGAGNLYAESSTNNTPGLGFYQSSGVDVFTQGQITLLKKMKQAASGATTHTRIRANTNGFSAVADGKLYTAPAASGTYTSLHAPAAKTIVDGLVANTFFYDIASDGTLYEGTVASPGTATTWPCGTTPTRLGWGKYRLWIIGGRKIWQPDLTLAGGTTQNPIFTNPNQGWTYTCMAEGPQAMYFGGHDGNVSSIHAVTLDSGGGLPTLSGVVVSSVLPDGELVQEIDIVAGQFVGIGTNRGFRVGVINADGGITYGPLLFEPTGVTGCTAVTAHGKFFVAAFSTTTGNAMAYRIDTSVQISDGVFPYAADIDCGFVGNINSICGNGKYLVTTASDGKVWYQSSTEYVDTGYIQTGRIRYRTTEPKSFRFFGLEIEPLNGNIAVSIIKDDTSTVALGSITSQGSVFTDQMTYSGDPMRYIGLRIDLTPTNDKLKAPVINSFLIRSLPAVRPQRLISLPLLCYDREKARSGQEYGSEDWAATRLNSLLALEDLGVVLNFQDFVGSVGDHQVVIESAKFHQTTPPGRAQGDGGILLLELRTVDA